MKRITFTTMAVTCALCLSLQSCHIGPSTNLRQFNFQSSRLKTQVLSDMELDIVKMEHEIQNQQKSATRSTVLASSNFPTPTVKFRGHVIDGSAIDFAKLLMKNDNYKYDPEFQSKLKKQGFPIENFKCLCLKGEYGDKKDCNVILSESQATGKMTCVTVIYTTNQENWRQLNYEYQNLKDEFTTEYGYGISSERFKKFYVRNKNKIEALCKNNGIWQTVWPAFADNTPYKPIILCIAGTSSFFGSKHKASIIIHYTSQNCISHNTFSSNNI